MDLRVIHLSDIRDHKLRMKRVFETYEKLELLAQASDSALPCVLAAAGAIVCVGLEKSGTLLECLVDGMKSA